MSASSQSLLFICRSCRQSISRSSQVRAFSSTISRQDTIPRFQPTSCPELDALLLDWRKRVFTPAALSTKYQDLVFKQSRHAIIENEPGITVTMSDGEDVKLEPLNRYDTPKKDDALYQIAEILSESAEIDVWSQLPAFLEGLQKARYSVPMWFLEKLTRKANEHGKAGIIKQCAVMVKRTGLSLSNKSVTRELFLGSHMRFIEQWKNGGDYEKEQKFAQSLALMLGSKDHCGGRLEETDSIGDMRKDITVLGVLLEMAAARAVSVHKGRDVDGRVGSFLSKTVALIPSDAEYREKQKIPGQAIEEWLPLVNGIRLSLQVTGVAVGKGRNVESEMKGALKNRLSEVDAMIKEEAQKLRKESPGTPRRALKMLEQLQ